MCKGLCMGVVNGRVCVEVPKETKGAFCFCGSFWLHERTYFHRLQNPKAENGGANDERDRL